MRDQKRIPAILDLLGQIWMESPDLRLGQILVNATGHTGDMFYYEDDKLIEGLTAFNSLVKES